MTDHHGTSGEVLQTLLQGAQRVHVDIVGRLVEQQHIALLLQRQGELQAVALTTRERAAELALVGAREIEARDVGACVHVASTHAYGLIALRNDVVDRLLRVDVLMLLVYVGELHGLTHLKRSIIGVLQSHDHAKERGLSRTVGTYHAHDAVRRQHEVEVAEEHLVAESLLDVLRLDNLVAQTWAIGDEDLQLFFAVFLLLAQHLLVGVETRLTLGLSGLGCHVGPLQLAFQRLASLRSLLLLLHHALGLLVEPRRVVAMPGDALATVELQDPLAHIVEEVAVVGNGNHRALILLEVLLEPVDTLGVEVVGGLVEQQHVGLLQQQAAEGHASALTTREVGNGQVALWAAKGGHGAVELRVHVPRVGSVDEVLHLRLSRHQLVHLVGV